MRQHSNLQDAPEVSICSIRVQEDLRIHAATPLIYIFIWDALPHIVPHARCMCRSALSSIVHCITGFIEANLCRRCSPFSFFRKSWSFLQEFKAKIKPSRHLWKCCRVFLDPSSGLDSPWYLIGSLIYLIHLSFTFSGCFSASSIFFGAWCIWNVALYKPISGWWFQPLWRIWKSIGMISNPILMEK